jgi:hypothetical protein
VGRDPGALLRLGLHALGTFQLPLHYAHIGLGVAHLVGRLVHNGCILGASFQSIERVAAYHWRNSARARHHWNAHHDVVWKYRLPEYDLAGVTR